ALRRVQGGCVDASGEHTARRRGRDVVRASETGDGVEQDDHVPAELDEPLGALDRELGDRGVVLRGAVERRGDDLAFDRALHVGDLFGTLVDEHDHEVHLGVVLRDRVRDLLQHDRLAGLRGRHDEAALALADRGDEVDDALGQLLLRRLQTQPLLRVERGELAELDAGARVVGRETVDRVDLHQRVVLLATLLLAL
ncbi:hypothetical protein ABE10_02035, partial [Bacillus toyonensis]|nr:hypothetical protein [Bacillus toyonensis]